MLGREGSYISERGQGANPSRLARSAEPDWRVRMTNPTLRTINQTPHITASSIRSLEANVSTLDSASGN